MSNFKKNDQIIGETKSTGRKTSTPKSNLKGTPKANSTGKKRERPLSPTDNTLTDQNKRMHMEQNIVEAGAVGGNNMPEEVPINPELTELKRQIFAGFACMLDPIKQEIKDIKEDQRILFDSEKFTNETKIERRFVQTNEKQRKLENRISILEDKLLEKNVIFQGIYEDEYEDRADIKTQIVKAMATTMTGADFDEKKKAAGKTSIDTVERVGKYHPLRTRPVKVKFLEKKDVDNLFRNRKKLPKGVFIENEFSRATEKERRLVRPILKAARRSEKYKGKVRMDGQHLVIDGKHYHRQNLHTLPVDLDPIEASSKTNETILGFFGELHPFSNFHPCRFTIDGQEFHSSEQFIQMKVAEYFEDDIAKERILNAEDAQDCKDISKDINNFNKHEWSKVAEKLCEPGITQKFLQNERLLAHLMNTGSKVIVESSHDDVWGTGQHLNGKEALNKSKWTSPGILGKILMSIRDRQVEPYLMGTEAASTNTEHGSQEEMELNQSNLT